MGVNLADVNTVIHYGAPRSLEDYFQECGRGGITGKQAFSTIYWCPRDAPKISWSIENLLVRSYLEKTFVRRRKQLIEYFVKDFKEVSETTQSLCCDVCNKKT